MTFTNDIISLTDDIDQKTRRAEGSAPTDELVWESWKRSVSAQQPSTPIVWDPEDIQQIYDIPGCGIVLVASLLFGTTSPEETLPEIQRTIADREEQAWTAEVNPEEYHAFESSTVRSEGQIRMDSYIKTLFKTATQYVFEDGMDNEFSKELTRLVKQYGDTVINEIACLILSGTTNVEVLSEALRSLGEIHHPQTRTYRLKLLDMGLRSSSSWVRDGAVLGLASLDDPLAIPYLEKAIRQEPIEELREDMGKVLSQLERTRLCHSS